VLFTLGIGVVYCGYMEQYERGLQPTYLWFSGWSSITAGLFCYWIGIFETVHGSHLSL